MKTSIIKLGRNSKICLTKLRANNNRLSVVIGRYQNVHHREEMLCRKCYDSNIEYALYVTLT